MCVQSIPQFVGLDRFLEIHKITHCQAAKQRLACGKSNYMGEDTTKNLAQRVFDVTSKFIAIIDVLALGMTAVDDLGPPLRDVLSALQTYPNLPANYTGVSTLKKWVGQLEGMSATSNLNEDQIRQLKYEIENELDKFKECLN